MLAQDCLLLGAAVLLGRGQEADDIKVSFHPS